VFQAGGNGPIRVYLRERPNGAPPTKKAEVDAKKSEV